MHATGAASCGTAADVPAPRGPRATGPYHRTREGWADRWVITIHGTDGRRTDASYPTREAAEGALDEFNKASRLVQVASVEQAVNDYFAHKRAMRVKESTLKTTGFRLANFFGDLSLPIADLSKRDCEKMYERRAAAVKPDTFLNELGEAKRFLKWAAKKRYVKVNPLASFELDEKPKRKRGKPQLHADEARAFMNLAFEQVDAHDMSQMTTDGAKARSSLAALCALLLAERTSEIVGMKVRDIDSEGLIIWVAEDDGKTHAARRAVKAPPMLAERLWTLAKDRDGHEPLWRAAYHRRWPLRAVKRICEEAGVPEMTAHGLRGTLATLAKANGVPLIDLAAFLGHADGGTVANRHYIKPGTGAAETRERGFAVLAGGKR